MDNQTPNDYNNGNYNGNFNGNNGNNYNGGDNGGNGSGDNNKKNNRGQMLLSFIMVTLVGLFFLSLFSSKFSQMSTKETTYSEFLQQLDQKNVKSVEFDSYQLNYTLVKDKESYDVTYYTGIVHDTDLVETLKKAKTSAGKSIEISAKVPDNTSTWILNILSIVIPLIFLWILFGFLMKRMGGGAMGVGKTTAKVYVEKTTYTNGTVTYRKVLLGK